MGRLPGELEVDSSRGCLRHLLPFQGLCPAPTLAGGESKPRGFPGSCSDQVAMLKVENLAPGQKKTAQCREAEISGRGMGVRPMGAKGAPDKEAGGRNETTLGLGRLGFPGKVRPLKQTRPLPHPL